MTGEIAQISIKINVVGNPLDFAAKVESAFLKCNCKVYGIDLAKAARVESRIQVFADAHHVNEIIENLKNEGLIAS
ncbi:MAG: hypothetical protein WA063_04315 [Minisyncoccia bacterium]